MGVAQLAYRLKPRARMSAGGWNAVIETTNPNVYRYVSSNIMRILYLQEMGLTWDRPVVVKPKSLYDWDDDNPIIAEFLVSVTKLKDATIADVATEQLELEMLCDRNFFKLHKKRCMVFLNDNPHALPITRPAIEWGFKHFKYISIDNQDCNFLKCPITGHIYPYDILNVDYMVSQNYLRLPIDSYWKAE